MFHHRRRAFTLVEMLIVIAIILVIAALGVLAMPGTGDRNMQQGADQLQGWLLIAKQRAKKDGKPTGVRINIGADTSTGSATIATTCSFIQQPDDFDIPGSTAVCNGQSSVTIQSGSVTVNGTTITPVVDSSHVLPGDYIEFNRGGGVYQINSWSGSTLTLAATSDGTFPTVNTTTEYRIRRQPILLTGEKPLQLPDGIAVDGSKSLNVPVRSVNNVSYYEILFSPQGGVVGRGTGSDQIMALWLYSTNNPNAAPLLVAIQAHTGFISVQSANISGADPYSFCKDPRASGL